MADAWLYDIFISYSHGDREWARRLAASLKRADPARRVFFDAESLRAGDDWDARIDAALASSKHFIVLWSDGAKASDWVNREIYQYLSAAKPLKNPSRRMICLDLRGSNNALNAVQHITHAGLRDAYPDLAALAAADWDGAMNSVEDGLVPDRRLLDVPVAVLTFTQADLAELSPAALAALALEYGLDAAGLSARYGASRTDWRPFDGSKPLHELMDALGSDITQRLPGLKVQWRVPPDAFWADIDEAQSFVTRDFIPAELSVLVIDPIAMNRHEVYQRLMLFQASLASSRTTIVTLPPFGVPAHVAALRHALMKRTKPYFDHYFKPSVPPLQAMAAHCGWNVGDPDEVRRLIMAAAAGLAPAAVSSAGDAFLSQRARPA